MVEAGYKGDDKQVDDMGKNGQDTTAPARREWSAVKKEFIKKINQTIDDALKTQTRNEQERTAYWFKKAALELARHDTDSAVPYFIKALKKAHKDNNGWFLLDAARTGLIHLCQNGTFSDPSSFINALMALFPHISEKDQYIAAKMIVKIAGAELKINHKKLAQAFNLMNKHIIGHMEKKFYVFGSKGYERSFFWTAEDQAAFIETAQENKIVWTNDPVAPENFKTAKPGQKTRIAHARPQHIPVSIMVVG